MELLPIVRESTGEPTGACLPRAEAIASGAWCRSTNIYVLDAAGNVLCHQRSQAKDRLPGVWMTHLGGHVGLGETYETNATKELAEEAGILLPERGLVAWRTTRIPRSRLWVREFVTVIDRPVEAFAPQPGEVDRFAWMSPDDIVRAASVVPAAWCAGTYDFPTDYQCLRAAVAAASSLGAVNGAGLCVWHPANA